MSNSFQSGGDVILQVKSIDEARAFYGGLLGFPVTCDEESLVGFDTGAFTLYIEPGAMPEPVFEFFVPDFQAAKEQLLAAGCVIVDEDPDVPRCYMRDPFGLVFNLAEHGR